MWDPQQGRWIVSCRSWVYAMLCKTRLPDSSVQVLWQKGGTMQTSYQVDTGLPFLFYFLRGTSIAPFKLLSTAWFLGHCLWPCKGLFHSTTSRWRTHRHLCHVQLSPGGTKMSTMHLMLLLSCVGMGGCTRTSTKDIESTSGISGGALKVLAGGALCLGMSFETGKDADKRLWKRESTK